MTRVTTVLSMLQIFRTLTLILTLLHTLHAAQSKLKVTLDISKAPECKEFAEKSQLIAEEWYPKIHALLFHKKHDLPEKAITLIYEPMDGVAYARGNEIHISADWLKKSPADYGMVVHELVHIVQDYQGKGESWLTEGLADYVRYEHFEKNKNKWAFDPQRSSYKQGYGIAGGFLAWLDQEKAKNKNIIRKLNIACHDGSYDDQTFKKICGNDVDTLWQEYTTAKTSK